MQLFGYFRLKILDFLLPNHTCLVCGGELNAPSNNFMCDTCVVALPINTEPLTLVNKEAKQHFHRAFAAFRYDKPIVEMLLQLKYNAVGDVAVALAPYMAAVLITTPSRLRRATPSKEGEPILVPVPLCKKRLKKRGYNQSELLAKEIGEILNYPVLSDVLIRTRDTTPQKKMTVKEREENLRGAFSILDASKIIGSRVILVDDVFTSGSTANECAKVLKAAGAKQVDAIVAARVGFE